jgi:hypothetical protein
VAKNDEVIAPVSLFGIRQLGFLLVFIDRVNQGDWILARRNQREGLAAAAFFRRSHNGLLHAVETFPRSLATYDVDLLPNSFTEDVVGISHGRQRDNDSPRICIQNDQPSR